jgi:hypothetical protein
MPVIRHAESRRTETPNAVMTTLASPTLGGAGHSMWRVDMRPGAGDPCTRSMPSRWTVVDGGATVELDGETLQRGAGRHSRHARRSAAPRAAPTRRRASPPSSSPHPTRRASTRRHQDRASLTM